MASIRPCFALVLGFLLSGGCSSDGTINPQAMEMLGAIDPRLRSGSKEMTAVSGALEFWSAANLSDAEAKQIGEATAVAIVNQPEFRLSSDDRLNAYVTKVGLTIAAVSPRTDIDYTFGVLESASANAFSMPGGYIFVTRGALSRMQDESELAGVLAHEVAHICLEHGKTILKDSKMLQGLGKMATADERAAQFRSVVKDFANEVVTKAFNPEKELAADREAIRYVRLAGYDPGGLARYLSRVSTGGTSAGFFRTHPITSERLSRIQGLAGGASGAVLKERFAAHVR
ncbi:MAG: M48 family metalloprotease [Phycisphaerae bacterium]|nr:M48 family metalloprotease [Phycisphaerae bacterium]MDW8261866.1 M48 family metalloprotease [Phycisphaerales bacterium]